MLFNGIFSAEKITMSLTLDIISEPLTNNIDRNEICTPASEINFSLLCQLSYEARKVHVENYFAPENIHK